MQIEDYHGDINAYNHSVNDTYEHINQSYFYEQVKATTAIAGQLLEPIAFDHKIRLPLVFVFR